MTAGRGRQDRDNKACVARKCTFVCPLEKNWRGVLCEEAKGVQEDRVEKPEKLRERADWAANEFGPSPLPDERLTKRLLNVSQDFFPQPGATIPQACGSRSKTKAAYRFFDNERVTTNG